MSKTIYQLTPIARVLRTAATVLTGSTMLWPVAIPANPTGGQVVNGQAQITNPATGGTVINQQSNAAIINWQDFSIGDGEYVVFNQPSVSAATLNRVIGNLPSEILGNLTANGRVFVINPQGVMFGANAKVDVGALVTSTGNISNEDFLAGKLKFSGTSAAGVVNRGQISAANGGFVVLSADKVTNSGTINAPNGDVLLAAGRQLSLQLDPEGLVSYSVDAAAASASAGVENFGDIIANGGAVIMAANVARSLIGTAINNSGRVSARGIEQRGGEIFLVAEGGNIEQRGTLDASSAQGDGGTIDIRSNQSILLAGGSTTDASGRNGGDAVAVAGQTLDYEQGARMSVAGRGNGAGGFAELSGRTVKIGDIVDIGRGTLLIDPVDFLVSNSGGDITYATLQSQLDNTFSGGTVLVEGENSVSFEAVSGGSFISNGISAGYGGVLKVVAGCNPSCIGGPSALDPGIFFGAADSFAINGGIELDVTVGDGVISGSGVNLSSSAGDIRATAPGQINLGNLTASGAGHSIYITSTAGGIGLGTLSATNEITTQSELNTTIGAIAAADELKIASTSGSVLTGITAATLGSVDIDAGTDITVVGNGTGTAVSSIVDMTAGGAINAANYGPLSASGISITADAFDGSDSPAIDLGGTNLAATSSVYVMASNGSIVVGDVSAVTPAFNSTEASIELTADGNITAGNLSATQGYGGNATVSVTADGDPATRTVSVGDITVNAVRAANVSIFGTDSVYVGDVSATANSTLEASTNVEIYANGNDGAAESTELQVGQVNSSVSGGSTYVLRTYVALGNEGYNSDGGGDVGVGLITTTNNATANSSTGSGSTVFIAARNDVYGVNADGTAIGLTANMGTQGALTAFQASSQSGNINLGDLLIGSGSGYASVLAIVTGTDSEGNPDFSGGTITADAGATVRSDAMIMVSPSIDLTGASVEIGPGSFADFGADPWFLNLDADGNETPDVTPNPWIPLPYSDVAPSGVFVSSGAVKLGNLSMASVDPDDINYGPVLVTVDNGPVLLAGPASGGYLFVAAPSVTAQTVTTPLLAFNYRPFYNFFAESDPGPDTLPLIFNNIGGALRTDVLTYLLGGTGYAGDITFGPFQPGPPDGVGVPGGGPIIPCDCINDLRVTGAGPKALGGANYILYTEGNIKGLGTSDNTTGQVIVLKGNVVAATPVPTQTPPPEPTPTPDPTPTPTPVVTPTPTPVVTPTPTPVVTPTPTPVVTPTPTPVVTPTPTPVVTPTPTPIVTPTPTPTPTPIPMADMAEILTALAEAPKTDDPFLAPTPTPAPGEGEIQRLDTSYQIGEFSCDATGVQ